MTAVALPPAAHRDPRIWWLVGFLVVVLLSALALYLNIPYLGSFIDWPTVRTCAGAAIRCIPLVLSWYTDCGTPEFRPRLPL